MMRVTIYKSSDAGGDVVAGTLTWDGKILAIDPPDSRLMKSILTEPILANGEVIDNRQPEAFLRGLQLQYKSAYLRASKAEES